MNILYYSIGNSCLYLSENEIWDFNKDYSRFDKNFLKITQDLAEYIEKNNFSIEKQKELFILKFGDKFDCEFEDKSRIKNNHSIKIIYFPILNALLNTLNSKNILPDKIYLFATCQKNQHHQDTIYLSKIMQKFLDKCKSNKYLNFPDNFSNEIIEITENPADFEKMSEFFEKFKKQKQEEIRYNFNITQFTAGTAQIHHGLNLILRDADTDYYYIKRNEVFAERLNYFKRLNELNFRTAVCNFLNNYNYSAAVNYMKDSPLKKYKDIITLIEIMHNLQNYNYKKIFELKDNLLDENIKRKFTGLFDDSEKIINKRCEKLPYKYMFDRLECKVKIQDYVGVIIDTVTIIDNLRWYLLENNPARQIKFSFTKEKKLVEFNQFVEADEELIKFLTKPERTLIIKYKDNLSAKCISEINKFYYSKNPENKEKIDIYFEFEKELDKQNFLDIRNRIIHTFVDDIDKFPYKNNDVNLLLSDLKKLLVVFGFFNEQSKNNFDKNNETIEKLLKNL